MGIIVRQNKSDFPRGLSGKRGDHVDIRKDRANESTVAHLVQARGTAVYN